MVGHDIDPGNKESGQGQFVLSFRDLHFLPRERFQYTSNLVTRQQWETAAQRGPEDHDPRSPVVAKVQWV